MALRTSIAPKFPKLGFQFSDVCFLFQNVGFFGPGVGESGIFSMRNFKMWLSIFKVWFLRSGSWEFGATETMILIFPSISTSVDDTEKISRPCIRRHPKSDTEEISPAGLPSSMK